jgi:hypothetical protein
MTWKESLNKAVQSLKEMADSEAVKDLTAKAREKAQYIAQKTKGGALSAAEAFVQANSDPTTFKLRYLNSDCSIVSPSDGVEITRPQGGTVVIADGAGNGVVINASADKAYVAETIGTVHQLSANTYDLGSEDGINVVVLRD